MKSIRFFEPKSEINFTRHFNKALITATIMPISAILGLLVFGMPWGIDFLGGMEMQVKFQREVGAGEIRDVLGGLGFHKNQVQQYGNNQNNEMLVRVERVASLEQTDVERIKNVLANSFGSQSTVLFDEKTGSQLSIWLNTPYPSTENDPLIKKQSLNEQRIKLADFLQAQSGLELRKTAVSSEDKADIYGAVIADEPQNSQVRYIVQFEGISAKIQQALSQKFGTAEVRRVDFVDSLVSQQLRTDGLLAIIYAMLAIVVYISIRFDIFFAPGAIFALLNDTMVALLVFIVFRLEFDTPSVAAMLTILGYSINNTIVVYDRIRESLPIKPLSAAELKPFVNKAINDTMSRNINTTLTTLFASLPLCVFTTGAIKTFAIVLSVGVSLGALTSIYVAPAAYLLAKRYIKRAEHDDFEQGNDSPNREDRAKGVV